MSKLNFDINVAVDKAYQFYQDKKYHESVDMCIQVLGVDYMRGDVWNLAGIVMIELHFYEKAIEYFTQAIQCEPMECNYKINLAETYRRIADPERCIMELEDLLNTAPHMNNNSNLHFNLAKAYSDIGDSHNSIKHYTVAIRLDPEDLGAMFNLANAQVSLKLFGEAIELYLNALSKGYLDAGVNLANTYMQIGLFGEAVEVYRSIYEHYKDDGDFLFNYANALNCNNADKSSIQMLYTQAISLNPNKVDYYINYAHFLLKNLDFMEGFRNYEQRKKLPHLIPEDIKHLWCYEQQNNTLEGKEILVYHEQGFGDSIMFARFLPLLVKKAKSVCVIVQEPLLELFKKMQIPCVVDVNEIGHYDMAISLLSLPLALGIESIERLDSYPFDFAGLNQVNKIQQVKKIGICFSTDSKFSEAVSKSMPIEILMSALQEYQQNHQIEIYSLNKPECKELEHYKVIQKSLNTFMDTYEIIDDMDIVISIDTAVAHLSASMGKPTLVLLHKRYDWRWGNGISTSWYKNVLCFTQSKMHQWDSVACNLKAYLNGLIH